ncbi:endonuclease [Nocardia brasiliensis]|uniref:endonuclease n=1 Tax=Nocardia brasiliensis TaxID=37326 RepID=UPI001892F3B2|nr:endonuclease [Nocardia brasiliensis]MBF6130018.1 endonuclease [Nocardia brasiliensis]
MSERKIVHALLERAGDGYAAQAGIDLTDKPAPLFQLLVLAELLSTRISADIAVVAAKELISTGYRTPQRIADAQWQELVDALGRAHYKRYDESTATRLGANANLVLDKYGGDLRKLAAAAEQDRARAAQLLQEFQGIGPTGSDIFLREVQDVWTWARPYFDERAKKGAQRVDLPTGTDELAALAPDGRVGALAAALVRAALDDEFAEQIRADAR